MPDLEDDEERETIPYAINPEMMWAVRSGPDEIKLYINEDDTLTFDNASAEALVKALLPLIPK